jgi:hypothetical protein
MVLPKVELLQVNNRSPFFDDLRSVTARVTAEDKAAVR